MGLCLGCDHHEFVRTYNGHKVRGIQYDMVRNLRLAVAHYQNLCQQYSFKSSLKHVDTPFIDEAQHDPEEDDEDEPKGVLSTPAASVLMKVFYAARLARFDLLRAIASLASKLIKWTRKCDKQLERLLS